jgi:hypothetical protein
MTLPSDPGAPSFGVPSFGAPSFGAPWPPLPPGELLCVLTVGRTGSTLLQRLLNVHDQLVVFGEHNAVVGSLNNLWQQIFHSWARDALLRSSRLIPDLLASRPISAPDGESIEWANAFTEETALEAFRHFLEELLYPPAVRRPGVRYWGFKEIRYGPPVVAFLARLFPKGRFLVLFRDPVATHRSRLATGYWYGQQDAASAAAAAHQSFQMLCDAWEVLQALPDAGERVRLLTYEGLVRDPVGTLEGLAGWAGLDPFDRARVDAVLSGQGRSGTDADPARSAAFLEAYRAGPGAQDVARWQAVVGGAP